MEKSTTVLIFYLAFWKRLVSEYIQHKVLIFNFLLQDLNTRKYPLCGYILAARLCLVQLLLMEPLELAEFWNTKVWCSGWLFTARLFLALPVTPMNPHDRLIDDERNFYHKWIISSRDQEKGEFERFYSTPNRNLNFPTSLLRHIKAVTQEKWSLCHWLQRHWCWRLLLRRENQEF